jgi:hypothetical protein
MVCRNGGMTATIYATMAQAAGLAYTVPRFVTAAPTASDLAAVVFIFITFVRLYFSISCIFILFYVLLFYFLFMFLVFILFIVF